jgi:uncharacterized protein
MILEFSVGNFRSIKDIQTISFVASPIVSKNKEIDENNTFQATDKIRLLKSLAIYGANASGKSNFLKAMIAFKTIISTNGSHSLVLSSMIEPYLLSTDTENEATFFQIIFITEGFTYRYGFEATKKEINSEWLFSNSNELNSKEVYLYKRDFQDVSINTKQYKGIQKFKQFILTDTPIFKKDTLLLTALFNLNENISNIVYNSIVMELVTSSGLGDRNMRTAIDEMIAQDDVLRNVVLNILKESDTGIKDLKSFESTEINIKTEDIESFNENFQGGKSRLITTFHKKQNSDESVMLRLDYHGSEGTKKMYETYPLVYTILTKGGILAIDEFDARFHPKLSQKIIDLFNNPKTNPKNAQILVVTHDTNLLSSKTFRRDQILFVEKDKNEASHIYALAEFKGVRNDASFEKDYLDGRYGAVPFLNNFTSIFEKQD